LFLSYLQYYAQTFKNGAGLVVRAIADGRAAAEAIGRTL
jgi:NADPH-dependent glutamate synthase beta subunit-like oxidoreductase